MGRTLSRISNRDRKAHYPPFTPNALQEHGPIHTRCPTGAWPHSHLMPYRSMINSLGVQKVNILLLEGGISVSLYPVTQVTDDIKRAHSHQMCAIKSEKPRMDVFALLTPFL